MKFTSLHAAAKHTNWNSVFFSALSFMAPSSSHEVSLRLDECENRSMCHILTAPKVT